MSSSRGKALSNSLLKKGEAINDELSRKYPYYDKTYQTAPVRDGGNPFASRRNEEDQISTQKEPSTPKHKFERSEKDEKWMAEMGVKMGDRHKEPTHLPPREDLRDYGSDEVAEELADENASDIPKSSSADIQYALAKFRVARKVARLRTLRAFIEPSNVGIYDQHLVVNLPRTKTSNIDFDSRKIAAIENEISRVLSVRTKFSHFSVSSSFDGVSLEFLLV